jgi:hypothetical protein
MDQSAIDRAYILVHNYASVQRSLPGRSRVVECAIHQGSADLRSWVLNLRDQLSLLAPERRIEIAGDVGPGAAIDASADGSWWRSAYVSPDGHPLGATLVASGIYASPPVASRAGFVEALDQVAMSLQVLGSLPASVVFRKVAALGPGDRRVGDERVEAASHTRRTDFWDERLPSGQRALSVERSIDWSSSLKNMSRNRHICKTTADRSFPYTLVRAIITRDSGTCAPQNNYWVRQINRDFWCGHPADYIWTGSFTNRNIGSRTIFFTYLMQPGIWKCLDHWRPF